MLACLASCWCGLPCLLAASTSSELSPACVPRPALEPRRPASCRQRAEHASNARNMCQSIMLIHTGCASVFSVLNRARFCCQHTAAVLAQGLDVGVGAHTARPPPPPSGGGGQGCHFFFFCLSAGMKVRFVPMAPLVEGGGPVGGVCFSFPPPAVPPFLYPPGPACWGDDANTQTRR